MGLGINIKGDVPSPISFSDIQKCISNNTQGLLKDFLSFSESESTLFVNLHPVEESVTFEYVDGRLVCSAKTSSIGPGYHAYLVELLESLQTELQIIWNWDLEEGEEYFSDETDYFRHRDFNQLQLEMLKWLKSLAAALTEDPNKQQWMLTMPMGYPPMNHVFFAVSPLRFWTWELFYRIRESDIEKLEWAGQEFFIWWKKEIDAELYKKTGIALLNVECPWHHPHDGKEQKVLSQIDNCFEMATKLEPQVDLPFADWETVKNFLSGVDTDIPQTEFGYKKHLMAFDLPGKWTIDLPGNLYHTTDESSEVFYDRERSVRSICYRRSDGKTDNEYVEGFFKDNENAGARALTSSTDIAGKAVVYYSVDKEIEEKYWVLQGVKVDANSLIFSTIAYPSEMYERWAIDTWNSIRR